MLHAAHQEILVHAGVQDRDASQAPKIQDALKVLSLAPPGGEDIALRTLGLALHPTQLPAVLEAAEQHLRRFSSGGSSLANVASQFGACWQVVSRQWLLFFSAIVTPSD